MLHRCVATNRCCPKLTEEDYSGDPAAHAAHLYSNPYMHEDFVHSSALRFSMQEDGLDFPPSALALMYDPPIDDTDDLSEGDHSDGYVQDVDDLLNVPKLISSTSPPKISGSLGSAMRLGGQQKASDASAMRLGGQQKTSEGSSTAGSGSLVRRGSPKTADNSDIGNEGAASHTRSSSAPRLTAPGRPRLVDRLPMRSFSTRAAGRKKGTRKASLTDADAAADDTSVADTDGSALSLSVTSRPGQTMSSRAGASPGRRAPSSTVPEPLPQPGPRGPGSRMGPGSCGGSAALGPGLGSATPGGLGKPVQVEPRTLSRSLRDARACKSEVGAASIAAIMDVVAKAQEVPAQQRPNSDKWTQRLASYEFGMY